MSDSILQVAFDAGAKRILLPMASVRHIPTIPGELFAKFQTGFYSDPTDAVFKALGVYSKRGYAGEFQRIKAMPIFEITHEDIGSSL